VPAIAARQPGNVTDVRRLPEKFCEFFELDRQDAAEVRKHRRYFCTSASYGKFVDSSVYTGRADRKSACALPKA